MTDDLKKAIASAEAGDLKALAGEIFKYAFGGLYYPADTMRAIEQRFPLALRMACEQYDEVGLYGIADMKRDGTAAASAAKPAPRPSWDDAIPAIKGRTKAAASWDEAIAAVNARLDSEADAAP